MIYTSCQMNRTRLLKPLCRGVELHSYFARQWRPRTIASTATQLSTTRSEGKTPVLTSLIECKPLPSGDSVLHMWFQGRKKYPILSAAVMQDLRKLIVESVNQHDTLRSRVRALFLRSTIVGADIAELGELSTVEDAVAFIRTVEGLCAAIQALKVPVVYVVDGSCLGAGMEVAAACDLRIGVEGATFGMPETKLGIPSPIQARLIPNLVGWGRARELLYFGDTIDTRTAYDWGFLNVMVEPSNLDAKLAEWERRVDATGHKAVMTQKSLMTAWEDYQSTVDVGVEAFGETFRDPSEPNTLIRQFQEARKNIKRHI